MNRFAAHLLLFGLISFVSPFASCGSKSDSGSQGGGGTNQSPSAPSVTVTLASSSITAAQSLYVSIAVSGVSGTPTGSAVHSSGSYTSVFTALVAGSATVSIPPGSLAVGTDTLSAKYTPGIRKDSMYVAKQV